MCGVASVGRCQASVCVGVFGGEKLQPIRIDVSSITPNISTIAITKTKAERCFDVSINSPTVDMLYTHFATHMVGLPCSVTGTLCANID